MTTSADQDQAIARLLAHGQTYAEAGKTLRISESTVMRRMQSPKMRQLVDAERGLLVDQVVLALSDGAGDAVGLLRSVCSDAEAPVGLRLRAASELLTQLSRWRGYEQTRTWHPRSAADSTADLLDAIM